MEVRKEDPIRWNWVICRERCWLIYEILSCNLYPRVLQSHSLWHFFFLPLFDLLTSILFHRVQGIGDLRDCLSLRAITRTLPEPTSLSSPFLWWTVLNSY